MNFNKKRINKNIQKSNTYTANGVMSEQVNQLCRFLEVFKDWINVIKSFYNLTSLFCTCDIFIKEYFGKSQYLYHLEVTHLLEQLCQIQI